MLLLNERCSRCHKNQLLVAVPNNGDDEKQRTRCHYSQQTTSSNARRTLLLALYGVVSSSFKYTAPALSHLCSPLLMPLTNRVLVGFPPRTSAHFVACSNILHMVDRPFLFSWPCSPRTWALEPSNISSISISLTLLFWRIRGRSQSTPYSLRMQRSTQVTYSRFIKRWPKDSLVQLLLPSKLLSSPWLSGVIHG